MENTYKTLAGVVLAFGVAACSYGSENDQGPEKDVSHKVVQPTAALEFEKSKYFYKSKVYEYSPQEAPGTLCVVVEDVKSIDVECFPRNQGMSMKP